MNSMNMLKLTVAFLVGLVVALGGALIYVRSSQPVQQAAVQPTPAAPAPPVQTQQTQTPPPVQAPTEVEAPPPPAPEDRPVHKELTHTKKPKVHRAVNENETAAAAPQSPAPEPVQTAQATPPPPAQNMQPEAQAPPPTSPAPPPPPQPQVVTLQPGTTLTVRLGETLSTDHNYTGDTFRATLQSPIIRDGYIIADRGSQVLGRVVNSEKAGRVKGLADLTLALTSINTTDGQRITIQTNTTNIQGPTSKKRDVAEIAGGSALGAIIGAIAGGGKGAAIGAGAGGGAGTAGALATRGKPAVVQAEAPLTFHLSSPVTITEKMNQ